MSTIQQFPLVLRYNPKAPNKSLGVIFNEECSLNVFKKVSSGENDMLIFTKCLSQVIEYESKIDNDYNTFAKRKIYSIPDLFINGVPYRGSWFSKYVFRSICNGFLDDEKICEGINPRDIISARASGNTADAKQKD